MKTYIMIDVKANGPIPGQYSMTSLGAVVVDKKLDKTFSVNIKPISRHSIVSYAEISTDQGNALPAKKAMRLFNDWLKSLPESELVFVSDNNGFDWMFVCWYLWRFVKENPFGYYSENMKSLYRGIKKDMSVIIKDIRAKEASHSALEDARDNAEVLLKLLEKVKK
ncbi:MAG: exonuclease domain-containing protein [Candidatus Komeilibacteria bacterium]